MKRLFFTTVGTSSLRELPKQMRSASNEEKYLYITNQLKTLYRQEPKLVEPYSAELKSLLRMKITAQDLVQLICTDTEAGILCGKIIQGFLQNEIGCEVQFVKIEGLQVHDARLFRNLGVRKYLEQLLVTYDKYQYSHQILMNLTGGFKSVIPYSTIASMLLKIPAFYVFEFSEELIPLPAVPITVDYSIFEQYPEKFEELIQEGVLPEEVFYDGIPFEERPRLHLLVDKERRHVTLSGLGELLWYLYIADQPELLTTDLPAEEKEIKIRNHHGQDRLKQLAEKLAGCEYVISMQCTNFNPHAKSFIHELIEPDSLIAVDLKSDAGYSLLIKTTARNGVELREISKIIAKRYQ